MKSNFLYDCLYNKSKSEFYKLIDNKLKKEEKTFIITANPETYMLSTTDNIINEIVHNKNNLIVPDGIAIVKTANYLGLNIKERITGVEIAQHLLEIANKNKYKVYLFGATEEVINNFALYNYGLYICMIIVKIRKQSVNELLRTYNLMPLLSLDSLNITSEEIIECLNLEENSALKDIYDNLVYEILSNDLKNDNKSIIEYLKQKYNI